MDCSLPGSSVHGILHKNTGVGCHPLHQGIFPTKGSNPGLLHCRQILYHLSHQEALRVPGGKWTLMMLSSHARHVARVYYPIMSPQLLRKGCNGLAKKPPVLFSLWMAQSQRVFWDGLPATDLCAREDVGTMVLDLTWELTVEPGPIWRTEHVLTHPFLVATLSGRVYYAHLDGETEAQRGSLICPRPHSLVDDRDRKSSTESVSLTLWLYFTQWPWTVGTII